MASPKVLLEGVMHNLSMNLPTLLGYSLTQTFSLARELTEDNFDHRSYSDRRLASGAKHLAEELERKADWLRECAKDLREIELELREQDEESTTPKGGLL